MNVSILSSASKDIDPYYLSITRSIAGYLANEGYDLVFGAGSTGMMGICYDEFSRKGRNIYSFTTEKYAEDLKNLPASKGYIRQSTFEMKKSMFENSDLVVVLPGGVGTLSELFSFIEENRSNNQDKKIIVYDEDGYYNELWKMLDNMIDKGFISGDFIEHYSVATNKNDFIDKIIETNIRKR